MELAELYPWHRESWAQWLAARHADRIGHGLLVAAPPGTGAVHFAQWVGAALACQATEGSGSPCGECRSCTLRIAGNHPDFRVVRRASDATQLVVDDVRTVINFTSLTSTIGSTKVVVIESAEMMNRAAANALLKTLEEPPGDTYFVLATHASFDIQATIRSRCVTVTLPSPPAEVARQWLLDQGCDGDIDLALALGDNGPESAKYLLEADLVTPLVDALRASAELGSKGANPLRVARTWREVGTLHWLFNVLYRQIADALRAALTHSAGGSRHTAQSKGPDGLPAPLESLESHQLDAMLTELCRSADEYRRVPGLNEQVLLEGLAIKWHECMQ
jgi:DNA polymerase-3 subunit delta'